MSGTRTTFPTRVAIPIGRVLGLVVLLVGFSVPAGAQAPARWALTGVAGVAAGELPGPGPDDRSGFLLALRVDWRIGTRLVLEPGISGLLASEDEALFPEVSLQLELPRLRFRPYAGVGAGYALLGDASNEGSLHGAAGVRYVTGGVWDLRAEVRPRLLPDGWYVVELTAGGSFVFR